MMSKLFKPTYFFATKITRQSFPQVLKKLQKQPSNVKVLREYYHHDNKFTIIQAILEAKLPSHHKLQACDQLKNFYNQGTDLDFYLLTSLHFVKFNLYWEKNQKQMSMDELKLAIDAIEKMEKPVLHRVSILHGTLGKVQIDLKHFKQAQNSLKKGYKILESIMLQQESQGEVQDNEAIYERLGTLYRDFSYLYYCTNELQKADEALQKSFVAWEKIPYQKNKFYEESVKYKCLYLSQRNRIEDAIEVAKEFLVNIPETDLNRVSRLWFMKFIGRFDPAFEQHFDQSVEKLALRIPEAHLKAQLSKISFSISDIK